MLDIALEITLCLFIAALIGFILGFIVAKATKKNVETKKNRATHSDKTLEEEIETIIDTVSDETEEIEIPTADDTQNAVKALKELDNASDKESQQPEILDQPRNNQKDTLTQIKGIGPKVEDKLNEAGIYHFEQIANWNEANIQWLEKNTTFAHRAKKDLWVNQAKSLI